MLLSANQRHFKEGHFPNNISAALGLYTYALQLVWFHTVAIVSGTHRNHEHFICQYRSTSSWCRRVVF
jgi:hypothetical protein